MWSCDDLQDFECLSSEECPVGEVCVLGQCGPPADGSVIDDDSTTGGGAQDASTTADAARPDPDASPTTGDATAGSDAGAQSDAATPDATPDVSVGDASPAADALFVPDQGMDDDRDAFADTDGGTGGGPSGADAGPDAAAVEPDAALVEPDVGEPLGCVDRDFDGYGERCALGPDCDDTTPVVHPGVAIDLCDGTDEDCDGRTDEDYAPVVTCGVGACAAAATPSSCVNGVRRACQPAAPAMIDAQCDGVDEDCDGRVDEDYVVVDNCGVGACAINIVPSACVNGVERACRARGAAANDQTCDGNDDDCDGRFDEDFVALEACGVGLCRETSVAGRCVGGVAGACQPGDPRADDATCDGRDDDCDARTDEDFASVQVCGLGTCAERAVPSSCVNGVSSECIPGAPNGFDVNCDGLDDDCDGRADEGFVAPRCGVGACRDNAIIAVCEDGVATECVPGQPAADDATCDGVDDDCDGSTDEDFTPSGCGVGLCGDRATPSFCNNGVEIPCQPGQGAADDATCDGVDDDCDGNTDEDYAPQGCGVGACIDGATPSRCEDGAVVACVPGEAAADDATCDGIDDDCDGSTDEGYVVDGSCRNQCGGRPSSCVDGVETACQPGEAQGDDATCDGVDDDCDEGIDEDYVPVVRCGVGACADTATASSCAAGVVVACVPGPPAANDATCDGIDDDCDGSTDEDFVGVRDCGEGVCADNATPTRCVDGQIQACVPGQPAAADAVCDGRDDDCDGNTDENYSPVAVCGVGACAEDATPSSCVEGAVVACQPGQPAPNDATCDGVDDDCDGNIDEDYAPVAECGDGACAGRATPSSCVAGVETPCQPGQPAASDASCDGADDDCDGNIDEDYAPRGCGEGVCAESATASSCLDGVELPCQPGEPGANDALCDGRDEDCDGATDEDYASD
ncbi:MAG: MopE-related protein, partial [Planctomycetota bacterium]